MQRKLRKNRHKYKKTLESKVTQKINKDGDLRTGDSSTVSHASENWKLFIAFGILKVHGDLKKCPISK